MLGGELGDDVGLAVGPDEGLEEGVPDGDVVGAPVGPAEGEAFGPVLGKELGDDVSPALGEDVGESEGEVVGPSLGEVVGESEDSAVGPSDESSSQIQVQVSGNSSLTKRQAPVKSNGPVVIPTLSRVATSDDSNQVIRLPQLYPSTTVIHTDSVHLLHPQCAGEDKGCWTGLPTGEMDTGCCTGLSAGNVVKLSGLKMTLSLYVLYVQNPSYG